MEVRYSYSFKNLLQFWFLLEWKSSWFNLPLGVNVRKKSLGFNFKLKYSITLSLKNPTSITTEYFLPQMTIVELKIESYIFYLQFNKLPTQLVQTHFHFPLDTTKITAEIFKEILFLFHLWTKEDVFWQENNNQVERIRQMAESPRDP